MFKQYILDMQAKPETVVIDLSNPAEAESDNTIVITGHRALRSDNGGEFASNEFKEFCDLNGISQEFSTSYTPNSTPGQSVHGTLYQMARAMLTTADMKDKFWALAVLT